MKTTLFAALATVSALALTACGSNDKAIDISSAIEGSGAVIATVNGQKLRESRLTDQMMQLPKQILESDQIDQIRDQIVEALVTQELVRQTAEATNLDKNPDYQKQVFNSVTQITYNTMLQNHISANVTADAITEYYNANKSKFTYPAVKASHILVKTEKEAKSLIRKATPENFAELAKEHSTGPSGPNGGQLGYFKKETMVKEFADAAFAANAGAVIPTPIKTQFGWHVVYVEDKQEAYTPPLAQLMPQIKDLLSQEASQNFVADLKENATIDLKELKGVSAVEAEEVEPAAAK